MTEGVKYSVKPGLEARAPQVLEAGCRKCDRHRELLISTLLIPFGILIGLLLFEAGYRMFAALSPGKAVVRDLPVQYYLPEDSSNRRDYSYSPVKPPNTYRIIVVGDSFTFGATMQIFDTYVKRLERYLNLNRSQPHVEVINMGKPGEATVNEAETIKYAVHHFDPDLILLQMTLNDAEPLPYTATHPGQSGVGETTLQYWLFSYWKSLGFVVNRLYNSRSHREYQRYFSESLERRDNRQRFYGALETIGKTCGRKNIKVAAVIFPVYSYPFDARYPFVALHERFHHALDAAGIPYLDLLPAYAGMQPERLEAVPGVNAHPNELANRIAADFIYRWLALVKFVPAESVAKISLQARRLKGHRFIGREEGGIHDEHGLGEADGAEGGEHEQQ